MQMCCTLATHTQHISSMPAALGAHSTHADPCCSALLPLPYKCQGAPTPAHRGRCTQCGCRNASPPCQTGGRSLHLGGQCPGCKPVGHGGKRKPRGDQNAAGGTGTQRGLHQDLTCMPTRVHHQHCASTDPHSSSPIHAAPPPTHPPTHTHTHHPPTHTPPPTPTPTPLHLNTR